MEQNTVSVSDQTVDPSLNESIVSEKNTVSVMGTELVQCHVIRTSGTEGCQYSDVRSLSVKKNIVSERKHCHGNRTLLLVEQNTVSDQTADPSLKKSIVSERKHCQCQCHGNRTSGTEHCQ